MIYLFTGSNGSGKTLNAIKFIVEKLNPNGQRPVFYFAPDNQPLNPNPEKLDWQQLTAEESRKWFDFPDGAIFYIDECRHVFPWRSNSVPVPDYVDKLSEHRSKGFDFILTAQKPASQFDPAIQGFIEEHRHLEGIAGSNRSRHFVYQSFCSSPLDPPKLQQCEPLSIPFDKKYYDYYRSASIHTKVNRLNYKKLAIFGVLPIVFIFLVFFLVKTLKHFGDSTNNSSVSSALSSGAELKPASSAVTSEEYLTNLIPRVPDMPESAPVYDELTKPKSFPRIAACIYRKKTYSCNCYTQQGTPLTISYNSCVLIVNHSVFNPYKEDLALSNSDSDQGIREAGAKRSAPPAPLTSL